MALQRVQQHGGEPEVALHELGLVLRAVDAGQVEHEVSAGAVVLELLRGRIDVILHNLERQQFLILLAAVLAVADVF